MVDLEKQFFGYAAGLTAFYASYLSSEPKSAVDIALLFPKGIADMVRNRKAGHANDLPPNFPVSLLQANRRGLLTGAQLYVRERIRQRRAG
jgi:hypothetical protein